MPSQDQEIAPSTSPTLSRRPSDQRDLCACRSDDLDYDSLLRAGVEVGYSIGRALLYGTGGYTRLELTNTGGSGDSYDSGGYFFGVGADYLITDRISIGREILQHKFSDFDGAFENVELDILTIGLNAAYRF